MRRGNGRGLDLSASARASCSPFYETPATACSSICHYSLCPPPPPPARTICTAHNAPRIQTSRPSLHAITPITPVSSIPTTPRRARRAFHSPPSSQPGPRFSPAPPSHTNAPRLQQPHVRYLNGLHDPRLAPFRGVGRVHMYAISSMQQINKPFATPWDSPPFQHLQGAGCVRCVCGYQTTTSGLHSLVRADCRCHRATRMGLLSLVLLVLRASPIHRLATALDAWAPSITQLQHPGIAPAQQGGSTLAQLTRPAQDRSLYLGSSAFHARGSTRVSLPAPASRRGAYCARPATPGRRRYWS